jgi:hypothetical protein
MKTQNGTDVRRNIALGLAVFSVVGSLTYLGLNSGKETEAGALEPKAVASQSAGAGGNLLPEGGEGAPASSAKPLRTAPDAAKIASARRSDALLLPKAAAEGSPLVAGGLNSEHDKGRVLRLKSAVLDKWGAVVPGERISLPTPDGEELYGRVNLVSAEEGWFRMGGLLEGRKGNFQLNAGPDEVHGGIYLPEIGVGYQIQMDGSDVVLVERRLSSLVCYPGVNAGYEGLLKDASGVVARATGTQVIPLINSRPGAKGVIYVDFAGGDIISTAWGQTIKAEPSPLSGDEITQALARAAEDFAPFDITLTTIKTVYNAAPLKRRMRVVVTPTDTAGVGTGGVAYVDSWKNGGSDIVCWVFNQGIKSCADTIAHEVGHTLGLRHHGTTSGNTYYSGHGGGLSVPTSWGPIMGAPFGVNLTQWSRGEYFGANNSSQDDVTIIATGNNFSYTVSPGSFGVVQALPLNGNLFQVSGTLVSKDDSHIFQFTTTGGKVEAQLQPKSGVGTGDFRLDLLDGAGASLVASDPADTLGASVSQTLAAGVYRLRVVPTGTGIKPADGYKTGYSSYGSLGGYSLSGKVDGANSLPAFLNPRLITATEETPFSVKFTVTDPDRTTVTKLSEKLPPGLTFNAGSLLLSGTPQKGTASGTWSLVLSAKSSAGETRAEFTLVVSEVSLPLASAIGGGTAVTGITTPPMGAWIGVLKTLQTGTSGVVAQSGPIADKGTTSIRFDLSVPDYTDPKSAPGAPVTAQSSRSIMTFYWQSDTEPGKDIVRCLVDGALVRDMLTGQPLQLSGKTGWVKQTVLLPGSGTRKIEFAYTKDANLKVGADRVWVYGVEVGKPPFIKSSPVSSIRVTPGASVNSGTFTLTAEAWDAKSVTWWKDGVPLSNGTSASGRVISGVTTGTLKVANAKAEDAGFYWLVARNDWGAVPSARCEVTVWVPPVVTSQPVAPSGLKVGDPLILTARVSGALPMFYQWQKDGVPGRWSSTPSLTISRTTASSAGKYKLVAVNPSGSVTSDEVTVTFVQTGAKTAASAKQ